MKATTITLTGKLLGVSLSAFVALSYGCAGDEPVISDPSDPTNPGDSDDPGNPDRPLDITGLYHLDSRFDLVSGMPGQVGQVTNTFLDMTDDPYDPATWVLDQIVSKVNNSLIRGAINAARPILDALLYDLMVQNSPQIVNDLVKLGDHFGQISRRFGTVSSLNVRTDADGAATIHTVTGYRFDIDNVEYEYDIAELGSEPVVVGGIGFNFASDRLSVSEHSVPLRYGIFLALALEDVVVPLIDPGAVSLEHLLGRLVNCNAIGVKLSVEIGFGTAGFYTGLCEIGLNAGADFVLDKLASIDEQAQVTLVISGSARASDQSGDRRIDRLTGGKWTGAIDYAGNRGDLAQDVNTFTGERM
jgi:hypothetical protein